MEQLISSPTLASVCSDPMAFPACGAAMTCQLLSTTENNGRTLCMRQCSLSVVSQRCSSAQHLCMELEGSQHSPPVMDVPLELTLPSSPGQPLGVPAQPPGTSRCFFKPPLTRMIFGGRSPQRQQNWPYPLFGGSLLFLPQQIATIKTQPEAQLPTPSISPRNWAWISQSSRAEMLLSFL